MLSFKRGVGVPRRHYFQRLKARIWHFPVEDPFVALAMLEMEGMCTEDQAVLLLM